jgi:hypothetical protein
MKSASLARRFKEHLGYDTEMLIISSGWSDKDREKGLRDTVNDFVALGGDSKQDLKILFYAGHGFFNQERLPTWCR